MTSRPRILVIEDDATLRPFLLEVMKGMRLPAEAVADGRDALERLTHGRFDLVITDVRLPGVGGLDILRAARARTPAPDVILMTAFATVEMAVEGMREGAIEFLQKPFTAEVVEASVRRAMERSELRRDIEALERDRPPIQMIGTSGGLRDVQSIMERVAPGDASVLIFGESGVGKELVAREIHRLSRRTRRRFVALHIPSLPDTLIEAELFGHEKGAFTGAVRDRIGLLELADGGTLFLDEVGDLGASVQSKLLRFLQERTFRRVGSNDETEVDVRVIGATNRDLTEEVRQGRFREDLYYRLNVVPIRVPPLRERLEDLPDLVRYFIDRFGSRMAASVTSVSAPVMDAYRKYRWPGNVRELENVISRALALAGGEVLEQSFLETNAEGNNGMQAAILRGGFALDDHVIEIERAAIEYALRLENGVRARAAQRLGIKRTTLIEKMKRLGMEKDLAGS